MITKKEYKTWVSEYFQYLVDEFDFNQPTILSNGNIFFDIEYENKNMVISISYEVIESYLQIIILNKINSKLLNINNSSNIINLKTLRPLIIPNLNKRSFLDCNEKFSSFSTSNNFSKKLLKEAKDLYLCLSYVNQVK